MAKQPLNLVVIYTDDWGYGDLGCYGSDEIQTPHLDALAAGGARFTNWYSNSPVCSPSRAALLTGKHPFRAGVPLILDGNRDTPGLLETERTLAELLKPHGYRTAIFGKWHLGVVEQHRPQAHGFDEFFGHLAGCVDYFSHIFYWSQAGRNPLHDLWHNDREVWYNGRYLTELITEKAVDFIGHGGDAPFFLYVPYNAPHYPMHAPKAYLDRYPDLPPERRIMAAMIAAVDDGVGSIVKALKDTDQFENTLLFFSSDNGPSREQSNFLDGTYDLYYGGSAGIFRGHKGSLFEGGIREPAIISCPANIPAGQVCEEPVAMFDLLPTFLELAGTEIPANIDGKSLLEALTEGASGPHDRLFWEYAGQLAMRQDQWKLVLNGRDDEAMAADKQVDPVFLTNLDTDPWERHNLKDDEPGLTKELTQQLDVWSEQVPTD